MNNFRQLTKDYRAAQETMSAANDALIAAKSAVSQAGIALFSAQNGGVKVGSIVQWEKWVAGNI